MRKFLAVVVAVLILSAFGYSQLSTANLRGKVVTTDGTPLPGVTVTLTGNKIGKRVTVTSEEGNYRFLKLPPGVYQIKFELEGFQPIVKKGIRLLVGDEVDINTTMKMAKISEEIVVTASAGAVEVKSTTVGANITKEMLQSLPTARNPWTVMSTVPGILMDRVDVGGSESGQQSGFVGHGVSSSQTTWNVDGANVTDQAALGGAPGYFNTNVFEEMQVSIGANDITAQTGGVQINFVSRRAGNNYSGDFHLYAEDQNWEMKAKPPKELEEMGYKSPGIMRLNQYGVNFGGPIIKDHFWFYGSWAIQDIHARTEAQKEDTTWIQSGMLKLNFQYGNTVGDASLNYNEKKKWGRTAYGATEQEYSSTWDQGGPGYLWEAHIQHVTSNLLVEARTAIHKTGFYLRPKGAEFDGPETLDTVMGGPNMLFTYYPRFYLYGNYYYDKYDRPTYDYAVDANYFLEGFLGGDHEIRIGGEYFLAHSMRTVWSPNEMWLYRLIDYNDLYPGYFNAVLGEPAMDVVEFDTRNRSDLKNTRTTAYIQDTISFGKLNVKLGLRYDKETGTVADMLSKEVLFYGTPISQVAPKLAPYLGDYSVSNVKCPVSWTALSPRIALTYDITGDGKTVLKASYSRYVSPAGINLADYASSGINAWRWMAFPWRDDGDLVPEIGEIEFLTPQEMDAYLMQNPYWGYFMWYGGFNKNDPQGYATTAKFDKDFNYPKTDEVIVSIEKEILTDFAVALRGVYKKNTNSVWSKGYWINEDGSITIENKDMWKVVDTDPVTGQDIYKRIGPSADGTYYTNHKKNYTDYYSLMLQLNKRLSHGWMMNASFVWMENKNHLSEEETFNMTNFSYYDDAVVAPEASASGYTGIYMNARWQVILTSMIELPFDIRFTAFFNAREGYVLPYVANEYGGVGLYDPNKKLGDDRLPAVWFLNLGLEKLFKISDKVTAAITIDAYNVTNNQTITKKETGLTQQGLPLKTMKPGLFQFGFRLNF